MADTSVAEATEQQTDQSADDAVQVQEAQLPESEDSPQGQGGGQIDVLLDTTIPVTARLGQVDMQVRELLQLAPGSVLKLDKQVGEPVEVLLRGNKFATGQIVVVGDRLGIRIQEILSQNPTEQGEEEQT